MPKAEQKAGLKIRLVRSLIGSDEKQIATANSLGLRRVGNETVQPENPQTLGKINKIRHLVEVTRV